MKKFLFFVSVLFVVYGIKGQVDPGSGALGNTGMFIQTNGTDGELKGNGYSADEIRVIVKKKYLTQAYSPAYVDDFKQLAYLRYNMYEDQMEFVKDDVIYFLKKEAGRKVQFTVLNKDFYKVYELDGKLQFFFVAEKGESSLLVKQSVRFVEPRKATTGYGKDKKADFKRRKDELYLAKSDTDIVSLPKKKKDFYKVFGDKSSDIKSYMKKNKLGTKKVKDLKKIIAYYNTL